MVKKKTNRLKLDSKIKMKVNATTTHYEGYGSETFLCVEPIGELEVTELVPLATQENEGLMSIEDKKTLDSMTDVVSDAVDKKLSDVEAVISPLVEAKVQESLSDINDKIEAEVTRATTEEAALAKVVAVNEQTFTVKIKAVETDIKDLKDRSIWL